MAIWRSLHSKEYKAFLRLLRRTRKAAGVTQDELAERLGDTQTYISKSERGDRRIDVVEFRRWCQKLSVDPAKFMAELDREIAAQK